MCVCLGIMASKDVCVCVCVRNRGNMFHKKQRRSMIHIHTLLNGHTVLNLNEDWYRKYYTHWNRTFCLGSKEKTSTFEQSHSHPRKKKNMKKVNVTSNEKEEKTNEHIIVKHVKLNWSQKQIKKTQILCWIYSHVTVSHIA